MHRKVGLCQLCVGYDYSARTLGSPNTSAYFIFPGVPWHRTMQLSYTNTKGTERCQLLVIYCIIIVTVLVYSGPYAQQLTVVHGSELTLNCSVRNVNKFAVWKCSGMCSRRANKTSESVISNGATVAINYREHVEMIQLSEKYDLRIRAVDYLDAGNYTCTGGNGFGELVTFLCLTVISDVRSTRPPAKTQPPRTANDGATASFSQFSTTGTETSHATAALAASAAIVGVFFLIIIIIVVICVRRKARIPPTSSKEDVDVSNPLSSSPTVPAPQGTLSTDTDKSQKRLLRGVKK